MTKKNRIHHCATSLLSLLIIVAHVGYADNSNAPEAEVQPVVNTQELIQCENPRPEICYEVYAPVCGVHDTKEPCLTGACSAEKYVTYVNDCKACADSNVSAYVPGGECD